MCCSTKRKSKMDQKEEINKLGQLTRLTEQELLELKQRFARMSQGTNFLTKFQFRDNLGLLGMGTMLHLSDRIFYIIDDDKDGKIRFQDFAIYFDKVIHGDAMEKAEISFKLIDKNRQGSFTLNEFNNAMQGVINSWIAMTGQNLATDVKKQLDQRIKTIFSVMDIDKIDKVTLEQFQKSTISDPTLMEIFDFVKKSATIEQEQYDGQWQLKQIQELEKSIENLLQYMQQKDLKQFKQIPHFTEQIETEKKRRNSQATDNFHSPIITLLQYEHENKFHSTDQFQFASFNHNQSNELSVEQIKNDTNVNQDFSFYGSQKFRQNAKFLKIPQKIIEDTDLRNDELFEISENFSEDGEGKNIEKQIDKLDDKEIKQKYKFVFDYVKDLQNEIKHIRQMIGQDQYKIQKMDLIDQINEQRLHTALNIPKKKSNSLQRYKKTIKPKISVSFGHENFNLVLNMMIGIQMAVNSINITDDYEVGIKDFKLKYYFELLPRRAQSDKSSFKVCQFFDYAPRVFNSIRTIHGIDNHQYLKSIGPDTLLQSLIKGDLSSLQELTSTGKSGSFFYYTADGKFTLKTIHHSEFRFLKQLLKNYYYHLKNNQETLIIKLFGMHKIGVKYQRQLKEQVIYFVIMSNIFSTNQEINVRYDLKGSLYGRQTYDNDPTVARKDLDFLKDKTILQLNITKTKEFAFFNQIEADCKFFSENNIIDYSLLLGIHMKGNKQLDNESSVYSDKASLDNFGMIITSDNRHTLYIGIIDILTNFSAKKHLEYLSKRILYGPTISAIPPQDYANRFLDFLKKNLFSN